LACLLCGEASKQELSPSPLRYRASGHQIAFAIILCC
jgi:hypothetical protein